MRVVAVLERGAALIHLHADKGTAGKTQSIIRYVLGTYLYVRGIYEAVLEADFLVGPTHHAGTACAAACNDTA